MRLTEEQLLEVEQMAGLFFSKTEIKIITGIEFPDDVMVNVAEYSEYEAFHKSFTKGRLKSEAEIRKSIFEHARNGSSPAQHMATKIIDDTKLGERF